MGKQDNLEKEYLKQKEEFADVINLALGHGKKLVNPDDIYELDSNELITISSEDKNDTEAVQKYRDVLRLVKKSDGNILKTRVIIGEEAQSHVHYGMPVRNMLYDAINYTNQIKALADKNRKNRSFGNSNEFLSGIKREDRIIPIVTIVVYFSPDKWEGPFSLHELIEWEYVPDSIKDFVQNYKVIILQPCDLDNSKLECAESTLGKVMGLIKYSKNKTDFNNYIKQNREAFRSFPTHAAKIINSVCSLDIPNEYFEKQEVVDVCQAVLEIKEEGKTEGKLEGRIEGRIEGKVLAYYELGISIVEIVKRVNITEKEIYDILERNGLV